MPVEEKVVVAGRVRLLVEARQLLVERKKIGLTEPQANIFEVLIDFWNRGIREVPRKEILKRAGIPIKRSANTRTRDLFRSRKKIWGTVVKPAARGTLQLIA